MSITVYILTTQGPVRIQRITEEPSGIQSVVCLDGRAQALPISSRYDAFVRNPTGVIERATGHGAYRIDVDQIIDDGDSWQLGIFIAHMLNGMDWAEDLHIFATGEVDRDLNIRPVGYVDEKLDRARNLFHELQDKGVNLHIFVPVGKYDKPDGNLDYSFVPVKHVDQIFDHLKLPHPKPSAPAEKTATASSSHNSGTRRLWFAGLPFALLICWFIWTPWVWMGLADDGKILELETAISKSNPAFMGQYQQVFYFFIQNLRQPNVIAPKLNGHVGLVSASEACDVETKRREVSWDESFSSDDRVCELVVRVDKQNTGSVIVGRMAYWPKGMDNEDDKPARTMRGSSRTNGHTWTLEFEDFPVAESLIRLVILQGLVPPVGSQPWFADLLAEPMTSAAFIAAKARIERLGYHVFVRDWQRP